MAGGVGDVRVGGAADLLAGGLTGLILRDGFFGGVAQADRAAVF